MSETVMPPTKVITEATTLLDEAVGRFLAARSTLPSVRKYESHVEALNMFSLAIRHVEAICELAKIDLVLLPSALVLARSAFETTGRIRWMLHPDEIFQCEAHFLVHLAGEEDFCSKVAGLLDEFGEGGQAWREIQESIHRFRTGVQRLLPPSITLPKKIPDFRAMLRSIGQEPQYGGYVRLSQFTHGTHAAGGIYRKNLGNAKIAGEFISAKSWEEPLRRAWWCLMTGGTTILNKLGGKPEAFIDEQFAERVRSKLDELLT